MFKSTGTKSSSDGIASLDIINNELVVTITTPVNLGEVTLDGIIISGSERYMSAYTDLPLIRTLYHDVTFNVNGGNSTPPATQTIKHGDKAVNPTPTPATYPAAA